MPQTPETLRKQFGIRFHHFIDVNGRLVATIASEPLEDGFVAVACSICSKQDSPTRERGRQIALGRLQNKLSIALSVEELKQEISSRTILARFPGGGRFGQGKVPALRPRAPYQPREVTAQP